MDSKVKLGAIVEKRHLVKERSSDTSKVKLWKQKELWVSSERKMKGLF